MDCTGWSHFGVVQCRNDTSAINFGTEEKVWETLAFYTSCIDRRDPLCHSRVLLQLCYVHRRLLLQCSWDESLDHCYGIINTIFILAPSAGMAVSKILQHRRKQHNQFCICHFRDMRGLLHSIVRGPHSIPVQTLRGSWGKADKIHGPKRGNLQLHFWHDKVTIVRSLERWLVLDVCVFHSRRVVHSHGLKSATSQVHRVR